jgi:hypothetical protein
MVVEILLLISIIIIVIQEVKNKIVTNKYASCIKHLILMVKHPAIGKSSIKSRDNFIRNVAEPLVYEDRR